MLVAVGGEKPGGLHSPFSCDRCEDHPLILLQMIPRRLGVLSPLAHQRARTGDSSFCFGKKKDVLQPESCRNSLAFSGKGESAGGGNSEAAGREEGKSITG